MKGSKQKVIDKLCDFGYGFTEFHTKDIQELLNIIEIQEKDIAKRNDFIDKLEQDLCKLEKHLNK